MANEITKAPEGGMTAQDVGKLVESLVTRGDVSGLGPAERARHYLTMCARLGIDAHTQPFAFLRLNGKEVMYATRGATDQLARIHRINRRIVDGPKVLDVAGTKLVYALCEVSMPDGRTETATATVPLTDPVNVLMKCETKAKRRATLSILGLGMLDEMELETIPARSQEPGGGVDLALASNHDESAPENAEESDAAEPPAALVSFLARVAEIDLPGEGVAVWIKHRHELGALNAADRETAWKQLCARVEVAGKMKNAKVWLKKAIAEEDARRGSVSAHDPEEPPPDGTTTPSKARKGTTTTEGSAVASTGTGGAPKATARGPVVLPDWAFSRDAIRVHAASDWSCKPHAENSVRLWGAFVPGLAEVASSWLQARGYDEATADGMTAVWSKEGPRPRTVKATRKGRKAA